MTEITVVGGGIAGLVASIACAERGASVRLLEAHDALGGRGRSADGPYVTNFGPHVLYSNGALWAFMAERDLLPEMAEPPQGPLRFRRAGLVGARPDGFSRIVGQLMAAGEPPVEESFRAWASRYGDEDDADLLARACGVFCFHHDPGELSAAFVWAGFVQAFGTMPSPARYARRRLGRARRSARAGRARCRRPHRDGHARQRAEWGPDDRRDGAGAGTRAARRRDADVDERPHRRARPRPALRQRRGSVCRLGLRRVRLGRALHRDRRDARARGP